MIEICEGFMIIRALAQLPEDRMCFDFARIAPIVSMEDVYYGLMGKTYV